MMMENRDVIGDVDPALGQLAGNNSELSLKERSQLDQDDLFRLAKNLHVMEKWINKDEHRAAETLYRMYSTLTNQRVLIRRNVSCAGAFVKTPGMLEPCVITVKENEGGRAEKGRLQTFD
eukprot:763856-Hanusia_phi.AAC.2